MFTLALLASLTMTGQPPKEKLVSGVVTAVSESSVTVGSESYRLTKDTLYLLESGFDPWVVRAKDLVKGKAVDLAVADGVVVRVFIRQFVPLAPGEVLRLDDPLFRLAPHASGVALAEVVGGEGVRRPADGREQGRQVQAEAGPRLRVLPRHGRRGHRVRRAATARERDRSRPPR